MTYSLNISSTWSPLLSRIISKSECDSVCKASTCLQAVPEGIVSPLIASGVEVISFASICHCWLKFCKEVMSCDPLLIWVSGSFGLWTIMSPCSTLVKTFRPTKVPSEVWKTSFEAMSESYSRRRSSCSRVWRSRSWALNRWYASATSTLL